MAKCQLKLIRNNRMRLNFHPWLRFNTLFEITVECTYSISDVNENTVELQYFMP